MPPWSAAHLGRIDRLQNGFRHCTFPNGGIVSLFKTSQHNRFNIGAEGQFIAHREKRRHGAAALRADMHTVHIISFVAEI